MSTATIFLENRLHQRLAAAADLAGQSEHDFIVDAIVKAVEHAELEEEAFRVADERWSQMLATGKTAPWGEAKQHLAARAQGAYANKPAAKNWTTHAAHDLHLERFGGT